MSNEVPKMQVGQFAGTPVDQLPISYLRWMLTQNFPRELLEVAKKKVEASTHSSNVKVSVSRHALDVYSLRFLQQWAYGVGAKGIGFASFVASEAQDAWNDGEIVRSQRHEKDGIVKMYEGIAWVFNQGKEFPEYLDVITCYPIGDEMTDEEAGNLLGMYDSSNDDYGK